MLRSHSTLSVALLLASALTSASAQVLERVDVNDQHQPGDAGANGAEFSHDGRFVVFTSQATNLGGPDVAGTNDVFLRDRLLATTTRITASDPIGFWTPRISGDGQTITFQTQPTSPPTAPRTFVHRLATQTTTEVIVPSLGTITIDALNLDGRFAAIRGGSPTNIHRLDLVTGAVVLCSRDPNGNPVGGLRGDIDDDGSHVSFESASSQLVPGDTNNVLDVFVFDLPGNVMLRASVATNGSDANGLSHPGAITGNGRYVTIVTTASNLSPLDTNGMFDVYVRDLRLGTTSPASLSTAWPGAQGQAFCSEDATRVLFASSDPVAPGDSVSIDVYLRDVTGGTTLALTLGDPIATSDSYPVGITSNGLEALFRSYQPAMLGPNVGPGVFVVSFVPPCSTSNYCSSLPNSTGAAATISAQGQASRTLNSLVIAGHNLPDVAIAMLVSGSQAIDPGTPFGNGLLCVGGSLTRHGIHVAGGGAVSDAQDLNSAEYAGVIPGDTRHYQIIYRDPSAGGASFNTTDAVAVTFCW